MVGGRGIGIGDEYGSSTLAEDGKGHHASYSEGQNNGPVSSSVITAGDH